MTRIGRQLGRRRAGLVALGLGLVLVVAVGWQVRARQQPQPDPVPLAAGAASPCGWTFPGASGLPATLDRSGDAEVVRIWTCGLGYDGRSLTGQAAGAIVDAVNAQARAEGACGGTGGDIFEVYFDTANGARWVGASHTGGCEFGWHRGLGAILGAVNEQLTAAYGPPDHRLSLDDVDLCHTTSIQGDVWWPSTRVAVCDGEPDPATGLAGYTARPLNLDQQLILTEELKDLSFADPGTSFPGGAGVLVRVQDFDGRIRSLWYADGRVWGWAPGPMMWTLSATAREVLDQ